MVALSRLSTQHFSVLMSLEPAIAAMAGLAIWVKLYNGASGWRFYDHYCVHGLYPVRGEITD